MSSNTDCGSTMDSFEISMKLSDTIYNEDDGGFRVDEDVIPDYVFPQEAEHNFNDIIDSGGLYNQSYYDDNYVEDVNMLCMNSAPNQSSDDKLSGKKRRSSLSSNTSELAFKLRHELTSEADVPEEMTLSGDNGIAYRYIADFSIYNNKLSRLMPLDCLPNKFESIYFTNEEGTLDSFVKITDSDVNTSSNEVAVSSPLDDQSCEELTLIGTLIPFDYIINYEKEKSAILKDNFRKQQKTRQKVGGGYKPKKFKEMPKSILKQGGLKTFQITCRIHSWTIEFGANLFDTPYIWVNSIPVNGGSKTCYRLCWPASRYTKLFSSAKLKFEVISRLVKTLLSPNSNRVGYKTFLDQITGKLADKPAKANSKSPSDEQTSEQAPEAVSEPTSETSSPSKKTSKSAAISMEDQQITPWGDPVCIVGLSEKEVLLMLPLIEYYLQTYSRKHNLSKTLGLQVITSMKNKLTKMILSEDSTLDENYISSNINSLLQNYDLMERIFNSAKLPSCSGAKSATATPKKKRGSTSKGEDSLKLVLPKFKDFTDNFTTCQKILKTSDFCHSFGDFLDLPIHSSSLLSILSFHSKSFVLEKSKCVSSEILSLVHLEFKKVVMRMSEERASGLVSQSGICDLIKVLQSFPKSTLFSTLKSLVDAISERVLSSKKASPEDSAQVGKTSASTKRSYSSLKGESESPDSEGDSRSSEPNLKYLDALNASRSVIDCASWPVILEKVLAKMNEANRSELADYLDESMFDDYNSGEQLLAEEEAKLEVTGTGLAQGSSPVLTKKQEKSNLSTLNNDSFLDILHWSIETLGEGKIGKEFIENVYNNQKKKGSLGRNDSFIGVDRFSNRYFLFNNINTPNTLNKSVVIIPSCMDSLHNSHIVHPVPCSNPLCNMSRDVSPFKLAYNPEVAEIQNFLRTRPILGDGPISRQMIKTSEPNYKILSKKKDIEGLMNALCSDHFCEFQLKLKLKSIFQGREFEHEPFNSAKYVQECISDSRPVFVPFNMSLPRMDLEKQFFYFSVLHIIREVSMVYLKVVFPMLVCAMNEVQLHFSIMDQISVLSIQVLENFSRGVDVTYYLSQEIIKRTVNLIKLICETTMDSLDSFGIQTDKQLSNSYLVWLRELEALGGISSPEEGTRVVLGDAISSSFNRRIAVIAAYLRIWMQDIVPGDLISISLGGGGWSSLSQDSAKSFNSGFVFNREEFISILTKNGGKHLEDLDKHIPKQLDQLYYFKSGHFLVSLSWMNSVLTKNRKANGAILRLIERFTDIPAHMANVEKIKIMNICYNTGNQMGIPPDAATGNSSGEQEAMIHPFILVNCQVSTRQNVHCADEVVEVVDQLRSSFESIQHLSVEHFSRKRTSNRIKNNNLSNSYRDAMIADSTFTIAEPRDAFVKKNLSYDQESQNEIRYISLILPLTLSGQNSGLPVGRLSYLQRRSFEIFSFRPSTPFYIISEEAFMSSIREITEKCSFKISYVLGEKSHGGFIRRITIEDYDVWDCLVVESDDSKKSKDNVLLCLNLWQVIPN
ncbi:hypothetical protein OJ252_23 [Cryptosporidium canis]|uniref:Uncharacterized protein n=1 Tax=Cryptosporidium canis TaxID=195482 RepID=A0ABQ8PBV4_9CRYT|nr:hypothetical protein OJ252_23 [Cryptosporidium canis]